MNGAVGTTGTTSVSGANKSLNQMIQKMNEENQDLHNQVKEMRRINEGLNGDILLKNQVIEDNKMKMLGEIQNLQSELDMLNHKYDRKELIL